MMVRRERAEILFVACRTRAETLALGAETPADLPASVCANTQAWGGCSPDILGGILRVSGAAKTPATWVIPGGDSAPTKMTTHLGDSRSEAEHHRNSWAELCSARAESPVPLGQSLRPSHSSTMRLSHRCRTEQSRKFWAELCSICPGRRLRP